MVDYKEVEGTGRLRFRKDGRVGIPTMKLLSSCIISFVRVAISVHRSPL